MYTRDNVKKYKGKNILKFHHSLHLTEEFGFIILSSI